MLILKVCTYLYMFLFSFLIYFCDSYRNATFKNLWKRKLIRRRTFWRINLQRHVFLFCNFWCLCITKEVMKVHMWNSWNCQHFSVLNYANFVFPIISVQFCIFRFSSQYIWMWLPVNGKSDFYFCLLQFLLLLILWEEPSVRN